MNILTPNRNVRPMTTTVTSATDLITDPEFVGFCRVWQEQRRAPFCFGDWLRDRDLWRQGEVADWASTADPLPDPEHRDRHSGPTPYCHAGYVQTTYGWWLRSSDDERKECDDLERVRSPGIHGDWGYSTFESAVAALLDNYKVRL